MNIFILGYKCDSGVRACGGRSGSELGPDSFRDLLHAEVKPDEPNIRITAEDIKYRDINIYDLGDIHKYQLSPYAERLKISK